MLSLCPGCSPCSLVPFSPALRRPALCLWRQPKRSRSYMRLRFMPHQCVLVKVTRIHTRDHLDRVMQTQARVLYACMRACARACARARGCLLGAASACACSGGEEGCPQAKWHALFPLSFPCPRFPAYASASLASLTSVAESVDRSPDNSKRMGHGCSGIILCVCLSVSVCVCVCVCVWARTCTCVCP